MLQTQSIVKIKIAGLENSTYPVQLIIIDKSLDRINLFNNKRKRKFWGEKNYIFFYLGLGSVKVCNTHLCEICNKNHFATLK